MKALPSMKLLLSTEQSTHHKPTIACLFCQYREISCGDPPIGSADSTCEYVYTLQFEIKSEYMISSQCTRHSLKCVYPHVPHRGNHRHRDNARGLHGESKDVHPDQVVE